MKSRTGILGPVRARPLLSTIRPARARSRRRRRLEPGSPPKTLRGEPVRLYGVLRRAPDQQRRRSFAAFASTCDQGPPIEGEVPDCIQPGAGAGAGAGADTSTSKTHRTSTKTAGVPRESFAEKQDELITLHRETAFGYSFGRGADDED
ncbi:hypothetical protein EG328_009058 [Venturia inaequalis]|uniref:Uncharacterized protein n=1 Tax=Venturia inaequalis TaxID=5025 RepID=A0A8H3V816_VENIN|nr:hypothetical protein EG328_009058 [Venturia inaequalis]